jgi:hypothetical protein
LIFQKINATNKKDCYRFRSGKGESDVGMRTKMPLRTILLARMGMTRQFNYTNALSIKENDRHYSVTMIFLMKRGVGSTMTGNDMHYNVP